MIFFMSFNTKMCFLIENEYSKNFHQQSSFAKAAQPWRSCKRWDCQRKTSRCLDQALVFCVEVSSNGTKRNIQAQTQDDVFVFFRRFFWHLKWEKLSKLVVSFTSKQKWCFFQGENHRKRTAQSFNSDNRTFAKSKCDIRSPKCPFFQISFDIYSTQIETLS